MFSNFVALAFGEFSSKAFGFLTMIYLANTVGAERFGMIGFASAAAAYAVLFANFGIDQYAQQQLSARSIGSTPNLTGDVLVTRTVLSFLLVIPFTAFGVLYSDDPVIRWLFIFQSIVIAAYALNLQFYFVSQQKAAALTIVKIAAAAGILLVTWLAVNGPDDLPRVPLISGTITAVVFLITARFVFAGGAIPFRIPSFRAMTALITDAAPLGLSSLMIQIYYSADVLILGFMNPGRELGYYTGAYRIILILTMISGFLFQVFLPELAKITERHFRHPQTKMYISTMLLAGGIVSVVSYIWGYELVLLILGKEYIPAIGVFNILLINVFMVFVNVSFGSLLIAWNRHKQYLAVVTIGAASNVIANIVLIPQYGIYGAAVSTVIAECAVFLSALYFHQSIFGIGETKKGSRA
jgi:O-antigen/teichoic acid export membrane protein